MMDLLVSEWKILWRDRRLPAVLACFALLTFMAVFTTARDNAKAARTSQQAQRAEYDRWLQQGQKYAHSAAHYGMHVFRPVSRLQNFEPGVTPYVGEAVYLEAHVQDPLLYRPADDRVAGPEIGDLTPSLLVFVLIPLFAVVLGYNIVPSGTGSSAAAMTLVSSRSTLRLLGSKALALLGMVLPMVVAVPLLAWLCTLPTQQSALPGDGGRWLLLTMLCAATAVFWSLTSVAVSSLAGSSGRAFGLLLLCWALLCLLLPRAIATSASERFPTLTQQQLSASIRIATGEGEDSDREDKLKAALLRRYGVQKLEDLPVEWDGTRRQAAEEAGNAIFDSSWGRLFSQYEKQQHFAATLSALSPAAAAARSAQVLANTDIVQHADFIRQAEAQRRLIQRTMNGALARKRAPEAGPRPDSGPELWRQVPSFHYTPTTLRGSSSGLQPELKRTLLAGTADLVLAAALFALAVWRKERVY